MARRTVFRAAARLSGLVAAFLLSISTLACFVARPVEPPRTAPRGAEVRVTHRDPGGSPGGPAGGRTRTVDGRVVCFAGDTLVLLTRSGPARTDTLRLGREGLVRVEEKELHLGKTVGLAAGSAVGLGVGALLMLSGDASGRRESPIGDDPVDASRLIWP